MGASLFGIALPRNIKRATLEGGETITIFELRKELGFYKSNVAAKRAYLEGLEPDLIGCSDDFIKLNWRFCANMGTAKIVKINQQLPQTP